MSKKNLVLKGCDASRAQMLVNEIGKVRCWLSGFAAARAVPGQISLNAGPPGEDSLRQIQIILKDSMGNG